MKPETTSDSFVLQIIHSKPLLTLLTSRRRSRTRTAVRTPVATLVRTVRGTGATATEILAVCTQMPSAGMVALIQSG